MPYIPIEYNVVSDKIEVSGNWIYDSGNSMLKYNGEYFGAYSKLLQFELEENPFDNIFVNITPNITDDRNDYCESKIFNSEFYQIKFVYDSFGYIFNLQYLNTKNILTESPYFKVEMNVSSAITSKFMFKFIDYDTQGYELEDYNNILIVSRNNEVPIFNSAYINYLKTGYNYDLKNKALQGFENIASGTVGTIANIATKNYVGAVSQLSGTITNSVRQEWNMNQKILELKNQSVSTAGADDLDLLDAYSGNRAKLKIYQCSDRIKKLVADLFYYEGYATSELKVPDTNTRLWFNFLQCEIEMKNSNYMSKVSDEVKEDIINKFANGVTYLHDVQYSDTHHWDFEQIKENYERSILQ